MISLPASVKIFLCVAPTDMRRSFDGLAGLAQQAVASEPWSGHLFVFRNRTENRLKILYWDRDGFAIWYKRLEKGTFRFPPAGERGVLEVEAGELMMLLEGVELDSLKRRVRYRRPAGGEES